MTEHDFLCLGPHGFHRLHYTQWGDPENPKVLVCVHGLTRNGRDFDVLARALSDEYRVVCPDMPGRGKSERLAHKEDYNYHVYVADTAALFARLGVEEVDLLGTSMGGLIGMFLASQPGSPIRRLIVNDIGPFLPKAALARIGDYLGKAPHFRSKEEVVEYLKRVAAGFGPLTEDQWLLLVDQAVLRRDDGQWSFSYDPGIAVNYHAAEVEDVDLWHVWDQVGCPTLVLRGGKSDLLLPETAREMTRRGPNADLVEFPPYGHAPMLLSADQVDAVRAWLAKQSP